MVFLMLMPLRAEVAVVLRGEALAIRAIDRCAT